MYRYVFSGIPNTPEGKEIVENMREYLNKDTYTLRVKGQYQKDGLNWRDYPAGQPINKSKCLRVYIDKRKD